ncbi:MULTISPECIES: FecR family protein [Bacteroides]|jgi:ferric-dicitrate binding protein FerR (iron transport regulator)|uniref:FecR family protein n=1 Tax=Bacteroides TaxID=816 RepID=UPI000C76D41C|nr:MULTISPECIES: FecR family protein [Bacteroides]RGM49852.1 FecR family protein [Bacteroides sp. OM08-11]
MNQELLYKYFKGTTSIEEEKQILDWVEAADENREAFLKERMLFDISLFSEKQETKKKTTRLIPIFRWTVRIAAAIIVAVSGYFMTIDYLYNKGAQLQTITVPAGQRAQIILADGTRVWLNSKSTLTYASNFGRKDRNVNLDGEAYFEVTKNKNIPFYVNTEMNKVRVVGTSFNVCAYNGSKEFETTLVEGIVDIYPSCNDQAITRLQKNEFFANYDGHLKKTVLPSYEYLRWKEGLYCFDDVPFSGILDKLEKYYNVKITVTSPKLLNHEGLTGKFREQDGIEHILRAISKDHPFRFTINEAKDSIVIYEK